MHSQSALLYLYLSISDFAVNTFLIKEKENTQVPIYYVSKLLTSAEQKRVLRKVHEEVIACHEGD